MSEQDEAGEIDLSTVKAFEPANVPKTLAERFEFTMGPHFLEAVNRIAGERLETVTKEAREWRLKNLMEQAERTGRKQRAIERMAEILMRHGIEMRVSGCGCCGSPMVLFRYMGETILDAEENVNFDTTKFPAFDVEPIECGD